MLARAYADWLLESEPSDGSRAGLVLALLRLLADHEGRPLPVGLRLVGMAKDAAAWALACTPAAVLGPMVVDRVDASGALLDDRLARAQVLGEALDILYGVEWAGRRSGEHSLRRSSGSYFTPRAVARSLVEGSLSTPQLGHAVSAGTVRVCDPAMGGGAFLLEAAAGLVRLRVRAGEAPDLALHEVGGSVFGYDQSALSVATAEAALWLLTGRADWQERLARADSLVDTELKVGRDFDWVIGNPPWVAFQGRAAQSLATERRAWLRRTYSAFAGYPTLHGIFAQRATQLASCGVVSLLLPSSVSDLDGYRAARRAVLSTHSLHEPLEEYGQDAFSGVVQPCFGLVASPRTGAPEGDPGRPWRLRERSRKGAAQDEARIPESLLQLASLPKLPSVCFGELGLQSNRRVTNELFLRADAAREPFVVPLLEGRTVRAFEIDPPRLFMNPDPVVLRETRCRYRPHTDYERVGFVVRQTAAVTIAARHNGLRFRNSLLAGYPCGDFDVELLLGLLNSALFRAFHASQQRDARQATFPQVKVAHLRRLPAPPASVGGRAQVRRLSDEMCRSGPSPAGQAALDAAVYELYGISIEARAFVQGYLATRRSGKVATASTGDVVGSARRKEPKAMNETQKKLVQQTWASVVPIADQAADIFYGKLFDADPSLKSLFKGDMRQQGKKLVQMISVAVAGLDRLGDIVPAVQALGKRHAGYGVKDAHYDTVGGALLDTLSVGLGPAFTLEVKEAWTSVYTVLATTMKDAAKTG